MGCSHGCENTHERACRFGDLAEALAITTGPVVTYSWRGWPSRSLFVAVDGKESRDCAGESSALFWDLTCVKEFDGYSAAEDAMGRGGMG